MGTRFLFAGVLLLAWMRWRGAPWPDRTQWRNALVVGSLMLGGGMGGTAVAEVTVGSGLVVAFIAVVPLMIAGLNLLWGVVPGRLEAAGIAVGLVGVLMLTQGAGFQASPVGLAAIATACVTWSVGSVLSQRSLPLAGGAMGFASEMICGGLVLMGLSALAGEHPQWPPQPLALAAWVYLVVFGSLIAFNAYMVLLARASAGLASSYTFVNPVIGMLLGVAVAGESVSGFEWMAAGVVLIGVVLMLRGATRSRA
jgi:drug/metabolite transporter (DMT)-like permease